MKNKMKLETKRSICLLIVIASVLTIVGTVSYAYFTTAGEHQKVSGGFTTATMELRFVDNDSGLSAQMKFGETVTKKFLIENTGTVEASLSMDFIDLVNTYSNGSLTYRLTMSETEDGEYKEIIPKSNVPVSSNPTRHMVDSEISVPAGETYYYNLEVTLNVLDVDQSKDLDAVFHTYFGAGQISKYRYHKLSVNPNGGVWDTYSSTQEYLLMNNETKTINNPTRVGYTFEGWDIVGKSSTLEDNIFSMGIEDSSLVARWTINKYNLTIDPKGGSYEGDLTKSVEYGSSVSVVDPTREGYTFTGWEVSGGTLSGTTYTMSEAKDATLTATWQINNYKYIVYHNKMNINGVGYTRVEADTDEGESEYNSTITPEVKPYTGFDSPSQESITIKHETVYPPVLNKVEYNYDRHQHTLTVEPNGGTYTGQTTSTMYYEATITLTPPTKTGYNFTNWTATTGTLNGNEFTMGDSDSAVTANYEAKTFSVTFNANGGETTTASKTVTYDSTYGELPTPTYEGYEFLGWFTAQEDGTEVKDTTKVALSGNQALFAHWEQKGEPIKNLLLGKANPANVTAYSSGDTKEMYVFDHPEAEQTKGWTVEERRDYRYIGSENLNDVGVNNYVVFNDETWRIIGVFTVETESGDKEQLIKIIRSQSIGNLYWNSNSNNEWSTASLQKTLNGDYYNQSGNYTSTAKVKGLNSTARTQIANVKWYLGGQNVEYNVPASTYYTFERSNTTCVTTWECSGETRTTSIIQNVGLMYPSDFYYVYANGVDNICFNEVYSCDRDAPISLKVYTYPRNGWIYTSQTELTQSPSAYSGIYGRSIYILGNLGNYLSGEVRPCVYLKSSVKITGGDGSSGNPYTLSS